MGILARALQTTRLFYLQAMRERERLPCGKLFPAGFLVLLSWGGVFYSLYHRGILPLCVLW